MKLTSRLIGGLLLVLAMTVPAVAAPISVSGEASYRERMLLPPGTTLEVRLEDQSLADAPARVIARFDGPARTSPTTFAVELDDSVIEPGRRYGWRATLSVGGQLLFTTDQFLTFDPKVTTGISLPMVRVVAAAEPLPLAGKWLAEDIGGGGVIDNAQTTLEIGEDGQLSGSGGCNSYSGRASISGTGFAAGPVAATQMACAPALMDQERKFFSALTTASSFEIDQARRKLTLVDAMGHAKVTLSRMD